MKNKKLIKSIGTLSTIIVSSTIATIPAISLKTTNNGTSVVSKNNNNYYYEDINNNPNFKVDISVVDSSATSFIIKETFKNNFPLDVVPNGYWTYDYFKKSYDGGKTFVDAKPAQRLARDKVIFERENRTYILRKFVDWNDEKGLVFTTNSKDIAISSKLESKVIVVSNEREFSKFKIELKNNDANENIKYRLEKIENGKPVVIDMVNQWIKVGQYSSIFKKDSNGIYYYETSNLRKEVRKNQYRFVFEIQGLDKTIRYQITNFELDSLSKEFSVSAPTIATSTNDYIQFKLNFEKYNLVHDYEAKFIEVDSTGKEIRDGFIPFVKKLSSTEYQIMKDNVDRQYKIIISSNSLGSSIIGKDIVKVDKKIIDGNGQKPDPEKPPVTPPVDPEKPPVEPEKPPVTPPVEPENPDKPTKPNIPDIDNNDVVNQNKNSTNNTTMISIMSVLSVISFLLVIALIITFINGRRKNKK